MFAPRPNLCKRYFSKCKYQKFTIQFCKAFTFLGNKSKDGAEGSRTPDLNDANVAFYQLNYGPVREWYVTGLDLFCASLA